MRSAAGCSACVLTGLAVELALIPIALYHFHRPASTARSPTSSPFRSPPSSSCRSRRSPCCSTWRARRALLVAGRRGDRPSPRSPMRVAAAPGRGGDAADHAARRVRADGRRRACGWPVAHALAAPGARSGRRRRARGAVDAGARPAGHRPLERHQHAEAQHHRHHRRAAEADQGQGDADHRRQAHHHHQVDRDVEEDGRRQAGRGELREAVGAER
jgi:hypothetical protein